MPGCGARELPPVAQVSYVVGAPYQSGKTWFYPREDFQLDTTGLAVTVADRTGYTANGERSDPSAMAAAHATLQLPSVARVTNLETGLQVLVRINDRGLADPRRLLGLTARAAERLGMTPGGVARVRLQAEAAASQALRDTLPGNTAAVAVSAPRIAVNAETLAPPPGISQSSRLRIASVAITLRGDDVPVIPHRLPETATRVPVNPGQLWIRAGEFGQSAPARMVAARLAALGVKVEQVGQGRSQIFRLRAGPYATVTEADTALDRATRAGVTDAHIVVE